MIRLAAVSPGGEVYITYDEFGTWRRHERYLPGPPVEIGELEARRAISVHDYTIIEQDFNSWAELGDRARDLVPLIGGLPPISRMLVRSILPELQERVRLNGTPTDDIVRLLGILLLNEQVAQDSDLRNSIGKLMSERPQPVVGPGNSSRVSVIWQYYTPSSVAA